MRAGASCPADAGTLAGCLRKALAPQHAAKLVKLSHRVDARSANALEEAEFLARAAEWSEFFAQKFPGRYGSRLDGAGTKQVFADGRAFAMFFEKMSSGRMDGGRAKRLDHLVGLAAEAC